MARLLLRDEQLPAVVRGILDEIENATKTDVLVEQSPEEYFHGTITFSCPPVLIVKYRHTLEGPSKYYPKPYAGIYHELLHMHRHFVERVPAVFQIEGLGQVTQTANPDADPELIRRVRNVYSALGLEMMLEHSVIEPFISELFRYTIQHCELEMWGARHAQTSYNDMQRWILINHWMRSEFLNSDLTIMSAGEQVLNHAGLLPAARLLSNGVQALIASNDSPIRSKEKMVWIACAVLSVPYSAVQLIYYTSTGSGFTLKRMDELFPQGSRVQIGALELKVA